LDGNEWSGLQTLSGFESDLKPAKAILEWVAARANSAGILAEQTHPITGAPLSVSPLTWSHAVYIATVLRYLERREEYK